jgi:GNAT superfamily N-acetyltransferase
MITDTSQAMLAHIDLLINVSFCCDPDGRLRAVNEPEKPPAPRFYMVRTLTGNHWRFRYDLPAATIQQLDRLCQAEPYPADLTCPPQHYHAIKAVLAAQAPLQEEYRGPAYWVPPGSARPANVVRIAATNAHLLQPLFPWVLPLPHPPRRGVLVATVVQEMAVALCYCARIPDQVTHAGVETAEAFRGQGYATAAVIGWADEVRRQGLIPLYGTTWENLASQRIAQKLGMVLYGEDWSIA